MQEATVKICGPKTNKLYKLVSHDSKYVRAWISPRKQASAYLGSNYSPEYGSQEPHQSKMRKAPHRRWHSSKLTLIQADEVVYLSGQWAENLVWLSVRSYINKHNYITLMKSEIPSFTPRSWISSTITCVTPFKFLSTSNLLNRMPVVQNSRRVSLPLTPSNRTL